MRLVSLIASATEMVHALGLGPAQVGRSHECDFPPSVLSLPVCTRPRFDVCGSARDIDQRVKAVLHSAESVYEVFDDVLDRLRPDVILTQSQCRVCAVSREDVERSLARRISTSPRVVALEPNCLADIWQDIRRVAAACALPAAGDALVARLQQTMERYRGTAGGARVACIEWQEPLMAAGNWTPELVEWVGAVNLFGTAGRHSPRLSWEELAAADPDILLLAPCGYGLDKTRQEMHWLTGRAGWADLRAVRQGRVYLADGNQFFNRPGPRVVEAVRVLAEILRGDADHGEGWIRFRPARENGE